MSGNFKTGFFSDWIELFLYYLSFSSVVNVHISRWKQTSFTRTTTRQFLRPRQWSFAVKNRSYVLVNIVINPPLSMNLSLSALLFLWHLQWRFFLASWKVYVKVEKKFTYKNITLKGKHLSVDSTLKGKYLSVDRKTSSALSFLYKRS